MQPRIFRAEADCIGIDPGKFNLSAGLHNTFAIGGVSAAISAVLGVALYLRQSPVPPEK